MLSQYVSVPVLIVKYPPGGSVIMMVRMVQCWMDGMGQAEDRCSVPLSPAATVTTGWMVMPGAARSCGLPSVIRNRHYSVQAAAVSHRSEID